jgi:hypothetical protein
MAVVTTPAMANAQSQQFFQVPVNRSGLMQKARSTHSRFKPLGTLLLATLASALVGCAHHRHHGMSNEGSAVLATVVQDKSGNIEILDSAGRPLPALLKATQREAPQGASVIAYDVSAIQDPKKASAATNDLSAGLLRVGFMTVQAGGRCTVKFYVNGVLKGLPAGCNPYLP